MTELPDNDLVPVEPSKPIVSVDMLLSEAKELVVDGEKEEALAKIISILKIDEDHPEALWMYANLNPNREKATGALKKLIRIQPDHAKAKALLDKWMDEALSAGPAVKVGDSQSDLMAQMVRNQQMLLERQQQTPVININNTNTATAVANGKTGVRNQTAYIVGLIVGILFGALGVAHLMNGKLGTGLLYLVLGYVVWLPILFVISSTGVGLCLTIPLHIIISHSTANAGARMT